MSLHDDPITLELGGESVKIVESYEIREGIISQPGSFSIRLGHGGVTRELLAKAPPLTPFRIYVGPAPIQYGFTDGFSTGDGGGATQVTFEGRDLAARIHDAFIESELSFATDKTYRELLEAALKAVGLPNSPIDSSNEANRKAHAGRDIVETNPVITQVTLDDGLDQGDRETGEARTVYQTIKARLGTRWGEFLKTQFDRAGLFMWADCSGGFVLSAPNPNQAPVYRIVRRRGITNAPVNVLRHSFHNNVSRRYTKCVVYGRGGGRNFGRTKNRGEWVDEEMAKLLGGANFKPLHVHDESARTPSRAAAMARRKIAEANRNGWQLNYTVAGHTAPSLRGGATSRAVWTPDTMVEVDDDELGIKGLFYLEQCTLRRSPQTETTIHLMRPQDLIFADPDIQDEG